MALRVTTEAEPICGNSTTFCMAFSSSGTFGSLAKHVEPGRENGAGFQRRDQRRLVDDGAARDVDQHAARAERLQHVGIDHLCGGGAAGHDDDQRVHRLRHFHQVGIVLVGNGRRRVARMIGNRHERGLEPASDRLTDAAHADDPDLAVAQRADAQGIVLRLPQAGAQIAVGLDELAQGRDQKPHRDVGDLFGQHVGRVGDDDIVLARIGRIDVVVADAEARDDFELGEMRQRLRVGRHHVIGHRHAADLRYRFGRQSLEVGAALRHMQDELIRKAVFQDRPDWSVDQEIDLFGRNYSRQPSIFLSKRALMPAP